MLRGILVFCAFSVSSIVSANPSSDSASFMRQRALGPIKLQTGLPAAASRLSSPVELELSLVHNNVFMGGQDGVERLLLDGESSQLNVRYRRRINRCWQVNVSGAVLSHSAGWFDKPLDDWHQFFHLPDAHRGDWPEGQLQYVYENGNDSQLIDSPSTGIGDVHLQVQHNWGCLAQNPIIRYGIKLPTGDTTKFHGSGGADAFVDVQSRWRRSEKYSGLQWAGSVGLLGSGENDLLAQQQPLVAFGVAGLNFSLSPRSQLLAQLDWHSPLFKSELRELSEPAVQLSLGWRYQTRNSGSWEFSFSEDAAIDTVPDIVVRLAWVSRFDADLFSRFK